MVQTRSLSSTAALVLLEAVPLALGQGHDDQEGEMSGVGAPKILQMMSDTNSTIMSSQSYFTYPEHGGLVLAHIVIMTIAWFFILPIGEWRFLIE